MATNPTLLTMPIAENGQKNTIPATQAEAGNGLLSQSTGFPPETALPLGAGGVAPSREDFNGAFNLLSGVSYYAQKGWFFFFDNTQSYFKGCVVRDATDYKLYECLNDVAAGGSAPSADSTNWRVFSTGGVPLGSILPYSANAQTPPYGFLFCEGQAISRTMYPDLFDLIGTTYGSGDGSTTFNLPNLIEAAMLNGSYTKTSYTTAGSATFTAGKTGWYRITVKGGGGGGGGGRMGTNNEKLNGAGGGEGGTTIAYEKMTAGDTATVVVGAGGSAGVGSTSITGGIGGDGGNTTITINLSTHTGGGGQGGQLYGGGQGGTGTIAGCPGEGVNHNAVVSGGNQYGGSGGGNGGGTFPSTNATQGGGGYGGGTGNSPTPGGNGGDGYATIEYIGISTKYMVKAYDAPTPSSAHIDLSQYASDLAARLTREQTPAFNKRDVITTSGTYTAPVTGWYRIVVKGGGGGGAGGGKTSTNGLGGGGGCEGGTSIGYEKLTAGQTATVVIGAGGTGGASSTTTYGAQGSDGGQSSVAVNLNTYIGGGGSGGTPTGDAGAGGTGTIPGAVGGAPSTVYQGVAFGGTGGGNGASKSISSTPVAATSGGGGAGGRGGYGTSGVATNGGAGGAGFAEFCYFDGSLN